MPPPAHLVKKPPRRRLKRTTWQRIGERLAAERATYDVPLNDLSFEDRTRRVAALMRAAYQMGRRDQRDVTRAAHDVTVHFDRPRKAR